MSKGIPEAIAKELARMNKKIFQMELIIDRYYNTRCNENEDNINDTQDALCDVSTDIEERLADIENALCELTEE